jgi:fatty-acyl-CoA synthase
MAGHHQCGRVVSLLNTNLVGSSLAHCIRIVAPKQIIVSAEFVETLSEAILPQLGMSPAIWTHGHQDAPFPRIDRDIERYSGEPLGSSERRPPAIDDLALYIYTSGTTGLPKAAKVSHAHHAMEPLVRGHDGRAAHGPHVQLPADVPQRWRSAGARRDAGGGGSSCCAKGSQRGQFWDDIVRWDCTLFQYIGELCRYLLHADFSANETEHRIRLACGNGLAAEIWDAFKDRFRIPQILEFYAATEGNVSLFNIRGKRGAIGHIPPYLTHRFSPAAGGLRHRDRASRSATSWDSASAAPRTKLARRWAKSSMTIKFKSREPASRATHPQKHLKRKFCAMSSSWATQWFRTGDLMRKDEKGYYYFVDRIGDTFRSKGENVATSEVAEIICRFPGVQHANVYGVAVPGVEGRVGMATLATDRELDMIGFRQHLAGRLPPYARPCFLRIRKQVDLDRHIQVFEDRTVREGYDPEACGDLLYFDNADQFITLDRELVQANSRWRVSIVPWRVRADDKCRTPVTRAIRTDGYRSNPG